MENKALLKYLSSTGVRTLENISDEIKNLTESNIIRDVSSNDLKSNDDILSSVQIKNRTCDKTISNFVSTFNPSSDYYQTGARLIHDSNLLGFIKFHEKINLYATASVAVNVRNSFKFPLIQGCIYSFDNSSFEHVLTNMKSYDNKNSWLDLNFEDFPKPVVLQQEFLAHKDRFQSEKEYFQFKNNVSNQIKSYIK